MLNGMVCTSQPRAVEAALRVLQEGGNAVDAAVAAAAVLCVVEPMSTGVGGDLFAMVWHGGKLHGLNSSGPAPARATRDEYARRGIRTQMPYKGILSVTVPGALRGWEALLAKFGTRKLTELLKPAIDCAENGFAVTPKIARAWKNLEPLLRKGGAYAFLVDGRAPDVGEVFRNPALAKTFRKIEQFYDGEIAAKIVEASEKLGGMFALDDLKNFQPEWVEPISVDYRGTTVYELPPNTQGLVALQALKLAEGQDLHGQIEAVKLAFADGLHYIADPCFEKIPVAQLLSDQYITTRRKSIGKEALKQPSHGLPEGGTVYITVVDKDRNVVSLIQSLFEGFGSGVIVGDTGIALQNRGALFSLDPAHGNRLEPRKRPYHTIIPAMAFRNGKPWLSFGCVGGFMQPQGHLQILHNIIDRGMDVQAAIDAPRFRYYDGERIALEEGIDRKTRSDLRNVGHDVVMGDGHYGGAQAIMVEGGELYGGSDKRKDGCVASY